MNNALFGKTMENVRKHRDIKFVTTKTRRNYLVSEPNYHATKFFTEHLLAIEMKKKNKNKQTNKQKQKDLWINCVFRTFNTRRK